MSAYRDDEQAQINDWAKRVAEAVPYPFQFVLPDIERFFQAGGDEDLFSRLERVAKEKHHNLLSLITVVVDCRLIQRPIKINYDKLNGILGIIQE